MSWFDESDKIEALELLAEWLRTCDDPGGYLDRLREKTGNFLAHHDWDGFTFVYNEESREWEDWIDTKEKWLEAQKQGIKPIAILGKEEE